MVAVVFYKHREKEKGIQAEDVKYISIGHGACQRMEKAHLGWMDGVMIQASKDPFTPLIPISWEYNFT